MKNLIKTSITLSFFGLLFLSGNLSATQKNDSLYTIEIDGKVLIPKNDDSKLYKIELLCHNTVVDSGEIVDSESFLLKIKKNSWYTIRIIKEGYYPMVVSIDTKLPGSDIDTHKFHFDTELISKSTKVDDDSVEFPIAIISFNPNKGDFLPVREYSKNIRTSIFTTQPVKEVYASK